MNKMNIDKQANRTRYKVLFNNLLLESESYIIIEPFYFNGFYFKVGVTLNTQLNRYRVKI